jgi:CoA-transferase family III
VTGEAAPLAGLRVLEICAHAALPLGARTLTELGAEVIRVGPAQGQAETARRAMADLLATSGHRGGIALTCTTEQGWPGHAELTPRWSALIHLQVRHREDLAEDARSVPRVSSRTTTCCPSSPTSAPPTATPPANATSAG